MEQYNTSSSAKFLLLYHFILVCKYRKQLLRGEINDFIKGQMVAISKKYDFHIKHIESDKDHIHLMVSSKPKISCSQIIRVLKQETTTYVWKHYRSVLKRHFWKEKTFWSDGYFVSSVGNVSQETINIILKIRVRDLSHPLKMGGFSHEKNSIKNYTKRNLWIFLNFIR